MNNAALEVIATMEANIVEFTAMLDLPSANDWVIAFPATGFAMYIDGNASTVTTINNATAVDARETLKVRNGAGDWSEKMRRSEVINLVIANTRDCIELVKKAASA